MRCWNCGKQIPETAKICRYCEANAEDEPTQEEQQMLRELLEQMPPEVMDEFRQVMAESTSAEDFANRIMVGPCPQCQSDDTGHCENDPEIDNSLVGRCYQCGHLFCTECQQPLAREQLYCPCWDEEIDEEFDFADFDDEDFDDDDEDEDLDEDSDDEDLDDEDEQPPARK